MSEIDKTGLVIIVSTLVIVFGFVGISYQENSDISKRTEWCESKGGVLLERTYATGKTTSHRYTCVKKEMIIGE